VMVKNDKSYLFRYRFSSGFFFTLICYLFYNRKLQVQIGHLMVENKAFKGMVWIEA